MFQNTKKLSLTCCPSRSGFNSFFFFKFIYFERETEHAHTWGRGREREGERESDSTEPDVRLELTNHEITT